METLRDLAGLTVLLGAVETLVALALRLGGAGLPRPALRLAALPASGLLAEVAVALAPARMPVPATLEQLGPHPVLAPLGWLLAAPGLWLSARRCARAWRAGWVGDGGAAGALWLWLPALGLVGCWLPPWALDDRLYHLSLPLHRLLGHASVPGHGNAGFFALGEGAASWALAQGSVAAARSQQVWACAWAAQALVCLLPGASMATGAWAQALALAAPALAWQLGTGYVDILVAVHQAVGAVLLWRYLEAPGRRRAPAELVLAAWCIGAAAGTKASALAEVWGFLLLLALGLRARAARGAKVPVDFCLGCLVAAAIVLPWAGYVARNLWRFHAPLYPFGAPLWPGGENLAESQHGALAYFLRLHGPYDGASPVRGPLALFVLPYALVFDAAFGSPRFDGVLGPLPALAAASAAWRARARRRGRAGLARGTAPGLLLRRAGDVAAAEGPIYKFGGSLGPRAGVGPDVDGPAVRLRRIVGGFVALRLVVWASTSWQARFLLGPLWWCAWAVAAGGIGRLAVASARPARPRPRAAWALALSACFWPSLRGHGPTFDVRAFGGATARHAARLARFPASALCDAHGPRPAGATLMVWSQRHLLWCLRPVRSDSYDEAATLRRVLRAHPGAPWAVSQHLRALGVAELLVDEALLGYAAPGLDVDAREAHAAERAAYAAWRSVALQETGRIGTLVRYRVAG